jgi:hypothetical protein
MPTLIENNLPFKIYSAVNLGSSEGMVFLGKTSTDADNSKFTRTLPENYYAACFSTFNFASIVPGNCTRIDIATESDPSIMIDSKWFDFRPSTDMSGQQELWPINNALNSVVYADNGDFTALMSSLSTDGTVVINGKESGFIWSDAGAIGNDNYCTFVLQAWKYNCKNIAEPGPVYGTVGTPGQSNVIFLFRSLIGGTGVDVKDYGTYLKVVYTGIPRENREGETGDKTCSQFPPRSITCEPFIPSDLGKFV